MWGVSILSKKNVISVGDISRLDLLTFIGLIISYFFGPSLFVFGIIFNRSDLIQYGGYISIVCLLLYMSINRSNYVKKQIKNDFLKWVSMNFYLSMFEYITLIILLFILYLPIIMVKQFDFTSNILKDSNNIGYYTIVILLLVILYLRTTKKGENLFQMGFETPNKSSLFGAASFADMSRFFFELNDNKKGIKYLQVSLLMYKDILYERDLIYQNLDKVLSAIENLDLVNVNNYTFLKTLSINMSKLPSSVETLNCIDEILKHDLKLYKYEQATKESIIHKIIKYPAIITLITTLFVLIVPNESKSNILNFIINILGGGLLMFILLVILMFWLAK